MKKVICKKLLAICLAIMICMPAVVYAIDLSTQSDTVNKEFFYVDKNQVSPGELISLNIDLSEIEYEDFEFELTSDINLTDIKSEKEELDLSVENDKLKIISSKSDIDMEKILLYYKIPEEMEIGSTISLVGKIQEYIQESEEIDNNESLEKTEENVDEDKKEDEEENVIDSSDKKTSQEVIINITVVESSNELESEDNLSSDNEKEDSKNQNVEDDNNKENESNVNHTEKENTQSNISQSQTKPAQTVAKTTGGNVSSQETITYNGESNNYLSSLSVDGYEISPNFSKTNNTYFINVSNDVNEINIDAQVEDENAKINIYGDENLTEGENKVLISITAENGEVRLYRIYVIKEK